MWPFKPDLTGKHIAEALAPGVLPSAREKALTALMALPQNLKTLECYRRIALDFKQVLKVRRKAVDGMALSANGDGARALLDCVNTDLQYAAFYALRKNGLPDALRKIGPEAYAVLAGALRKISSEAEAEPKFDERRLMDLDSLQKLLGLIAAPEARDLSAKVEAVSAHLNNRLVPQFLERALTSKYYWDVHKALASLERLHTAESKTALEKFRSAKSRLVEKDIIPGVGCPDEKIKRQVYTSEFGQSPCEEEIAVRAEEAKAWEKRHPVTRPQPVQPPDTFPADNAALDNLPPDNLPSDNFPPDNAWRDDSSQHYAAASSRGIEEELLALVDDQLDLLKSLHRRGSLAPLAAAMDSQGRINGLALTTKDPTTDDRSVEDALDFFRKQFQDDAIKGALVACAIFYHGCHGPGKGAFNIAPAQSTADADCIVALLDHRDGQAITCVIQYTETTDGAWQYAPAYYAPKSPAIFVDQIGSPLSPNRPRPRFIRRPAAVSDHGTHPESMTLVESQLETLKSLQRANSLAPVAASMKPSGEIQTAVVLNQDVWHSRRVETDARDPFVFYPQGESEKTPAGAIAFFVEKFRAAARKREIVASAIFFHSIYDPKAVALGLKPAGIGEEPNCLVAQLDHRMSQAISLVIRYSKNADGEYRYAPPEHHSAFPIIFHEPQ